MKMWSARSSRFLFVTDDDFRKSPSSAERIHENAFTISAIGRPLGDRRTPAGESFNFTFVVPWTGSGRGRFENLTQILRWWRRVSALLNGLNDLDVTPSPSAANFIRLLINLSRSLALSLRMLSFWRDSSTLLRVTANSPAWTNRRCNWREMWSAASYSADHGFVAETDHGVPISILIGRRASICTATYFV